MTHQITAGMKSLSATGQKESDPPAGSEGPTCEPAVLVLVRCQLQGSIVLFSQLALSTDDSASRSNAARIIDVACAIHRVLGASNTTQIKKL